MRAIKPTFLYTFYLHDYSFHVPVHGMNGFSVYLFRIPYRTSDKITVDENHDGEDHDENEVNANDREMEDGGGSG